MIVCAIAEHHPGVVSFREAMSLPGWQLDVLLEVSAERRPRQ